MALLQAVLFADGLRDKDSMKVGDTGEGLVVQPDSDRPVFVYRYVAADAAS